MKAFSELPQHIRWLGAVLAAMVAFLIYDLYHWWQSNDEYLFGMIVPFFVAFIIYDRWPRIYRILVGKPLEGAAKSAQEATEKKLESPPSLLTRFGGSLGPLAKVAAGLAIAGCLFIFFYGALYRAMEGRNLISSTAFAYSLAGLVLASVFLFADKNSQGEEISLHQRFVVTGCFLFPALIWMLAVPMPWFFYTAVSTFLMNQVAVVVYFTFDFLGYAIIQQGSILVLPNGEVGVEDACSGIRSLTACLFAGSFIGAAFFENFWKKTLLVALAMFFAFFNNILRSLFLTAWAYGKGPTALDGDFFILGMNMGNVHDFTGWVVLGLTVVTLLILVKIFSIRLEFEAPAGHPPAASASA